MYGAATSDTQSARWGSRPVKAKTFSPAEVEDMASALLAKGLHPANVRTRLAEYGVRWEYQFLGQGRAERLRRLKKNGQNLCGCGIPKRLESPLCLACLAKKWSQ